jgi:hypothetical protein
MMKWNKMYTAAFGNLMVTLTVALAHHSLAACISLVNRSLDYTSNRTQETSALTTLRLLVQSKRTIWSLLTPHSDEPPLSAMICYWINSRCLSSLLCRIQTQHNESKLTIYHTGGRLWLLPVPKSGRYFNESKLTISVLIRTSMSEGPHLYTPSATPITAGR